MRERSPSLTLTATTTVSPGEKSGTCRLAAIFSACSRSSSWMMFILTTFGNSCRLCNDDPVKNQPRPQTDRESAAVLRPPQAPQVRPALARRRLRLHPLPAGDRLVIARQQHLRDGDAFEQAR